VAITTNQFKNGNHIEVDGTIFKIVDFQHVKPGKGGAFVRTKLRRAAEAAVAETLRWCPPSSEVDVLFIDDRPSDVQLPSAVDLEVSQTDPGLRGDSVSGGGTKPATLETGAVIQVPLFVEQGQRIRVDTRSGDYVARA
jgi:elongation factor P